MPASPTPPKPSQDPYAQRAKSLTSATKRLRGWAGSDPSRNAELADALVELTAHRLLGHAYAAAAEDAQEAVRRSAEALTANGPVGPYTATPDAVRYLSATIHLATVQVGLGLPQAAGQLMGSVDTLSGQLRTHQLDVTLLPATELWTLIARSRVSLAAGEIATANTFADAAGRQLASSGLGQASNEKIGYLPIDVDRLLSDTRWSAGRATDSLAFIHDAKDRFDDEAITRLSNPTRLSPALVERLAEPLFGLYRDFADRLAVSGDIELGLVTRRTLVDLLRGLPSTLGPKWRVPLAAALADLATDLRSVERTAEADTASQEAHHIGPKFELGRTVPPLGRYLATWPTATEGSDADGSPPVRPEWLHADQLETDRAEAHRLETERAQRAQRIADHEAERRVEAERAEVDRAIAEREQAASEQRQEAERLTAEAEAERTEIKRRRAQRLDDHLTEEINRYEAALQQARTSGDRVATRAALESLVPVLRSRAEADLATGGPRLASALEALSSARLRSGDIWGSRSPAKELKALTKVLNASAQD